MKRLAAFVAEMLLFAVGLGLGVSIAPTVWRWRAQAHAQEEALAIGRTAACHELLQGCARSLKTCSEDKRRN
jgi:hypothetical protein